MLRISCLLILLLIATGAATAQDNRPWRMPGTKKVNSEEAVPHYRWSTPSTACSLLADMPDLQPGEYKNHPFSQPEQYYCASSIKPIGSDWPLENNLAYYAIGDHDTASALMLILNVNTEAAKAGGTVLSIVSDLLTKRALGSKLSPDVLEALLLGQTGEWKAGENQILVRRKDWPSGRGYELRFIIK